MSVRERTIEFSKCYVAPLWVRMYTAAASGR
jgi:hypothetical protein